MFFVINARKIFRLAIIIVSLLISLISINSASNYILPIEYKEIIEIYSKKYDVDRELIYAVINAESRFDENAISSKNAIGLMQILPNTGIWLANILKMDEIQENDLYNPSLNIELGTYYLSYLLDKFDNETNALASYNAGATNVTKWLSNENYSQDGYLHNIPFDETDKYIKKIKFFKIGYAVKIALLQFFRAY